MPLTPQEMRALYPITGRYAYLDHAAIAPLATPVRSTMEVFLARMTEEPFDLTHWERLLGQVRSRVAELLSVGPESIAFTKNTTTGLGLVAAGLDWEAGDNIVSVDREFPSNIYPWMGLKRKGVELRLYRPGQGRIDVKAVVRLCDRRTRVLAISAVQFWSGFRIDLGALGTALRGRDVLLVVDAIQAAGALRLDLSKTPIDFLSAGAQKWLLGPIGIGVVYVGPRMMDRMNPVTIGPESVVRNREYFEYDLMREELPRRGYELVFKPTSASERSGIVSFRHQRMVPAELHVRLREAGVIIALRGDFLRASPHYYNTDEDLDRLLEALPR